MGGLILLSFYLDIHYKPKSLNDTIPLNFTLLFASTLIKRQRTTIIIPIVGRAITIREAIEKSPILLSFYLSI